MMIRSILFFSLSIALAGSTMPSYAQETEPRILLLGDSWAEAMWDQRSLTWALEERGLSRFDAISEGTAIGGTTAAGWVLPNELQKISDALENQPTIDIVHLSIGGNDILGFFNPDRSAEERAAFIDQVNADVEVIVRHIHSVRSNIRVLLAGYDLVRLTVPTNEFLIEVARSRLELTRRIEGFDYLLNLGLMQALHGIPGVFQPFELPMPGGPPDYEPFPGGDVNYLGPASAFADAIHLSREGYRELGARAVDQFYFDWLAPGCPAGAVEIAGEVLDDRSVRITWSQGVSSALTLDIFRDDELIASDVLLDPSEFVDAPDTIGVYDYRLRFHLEETVCTEYRFLIDTARPCDTHCVDLTIETIITDDANVRVTSEAIDDSGNDISYRLFARGDSLGVSLFVTPQKDPIFLLDLSPGEWSITVSVDDGSLCDPRTPDFQCAESFTVSGSPRFVRGDSNGDDQGDISDAVFTLGYLFLGGDSPGCLAAANTNGDGAIDISDATYFLSHIFLGGPAPSAPYPGCGPMQTPLDVALGCEEPPKGCFSS